MSLKEQLGADIKSAMKAGEKDRLGVLRMIHAAVKQREVDERVEVDDHQFIVIVEKMLKQRRESERVFREAGRIDLADKEAAEMSVIGTYLPTPLTESELDALIDDAIAKTGAESVRDMGKVMGIIKSAAQGRADMAVVGARIKARLA